MALRNRNFHELGDIAAADDLIRYAVASQVARLALRRDIDVPQRRLAQAVGMDAGNFVHAIQGKQHFKDDQLRQLDEVLVALGLDRAGGLSSLAMRLRGGRDDWTSLDARIPPGWAGEMLHIPSTQELGVLMQGAALVSKLRAAHKAGKAVHYQYRRQIQQTVTRLILIGVAPPSRRNIEALVLLGSLGAYAFDLMEDALVETLRFMPLGFRMWRPITKSVLINARVTEETDATNTESLRACVRRLLQDAEQLRETSLYPGRCLDLELAVAIPSSWSPPQDDWATRALLARAYNTRATLNERGAAALGLWQRALGSTGHGVEGAQKELNALIKVFDDAAATSGDAAGMRWLSATLRHVTDRRVPVCNNWPANDEPWFKVVMQAAAHLELQAIPDPIRPATRRLFEHALLQNAEMYRRDAIDTIVTAGWAKAVTPAFIEVLENELHESWLRSRALFALGFLQYRNDGVQRILSEACLHAHEQLQAPHPAARTPHLVAEMHAALFAVGDSFGARGAQEHARAIREKLRPLLEDLVNAKRTEEPQMWPVARATAYLLTVTAQPRRAHAKDLSQTLLESLRDHPDIITKLLSTWVLSFRFAPDGSIRPLLAAAETRSDEPQSDPNHSGSWLGQSYNPR